VQLGVITVAFHFQRSCAVAIDTPSHCKRTLLLDSSHFLHIAVALVAFHLSNYYVLLVREENVVREIVNFVPEDRMLFAGVGQLFRIPTYCEVNFRDLFFGTFVCCFADHFVTVHTNVCRRDLSCFRFLYAAVAIFTVNFIIAGVNFVREIDWL
jgi:hypothetical protein